MGALFLCQSCLKSFVQSCLKFGDLCPILRRGMTIMYKEYTPAIPHLAPNKSHQFFCALVLRNPVARQSVANLFLELCPAMGGASRSSAHSREEKTNLIQFYCALTRGKDESHPNFCELVLRNPVARQSVANLFLELCPAMDETSRFFLFCNIR